MTLRSCSAVPPAGAAGRPAASTGQAPVSPCNSARVTGRVGAGSYTVSGYQVRRRESPLSSRPRRGRLGSRTTFDAPPSAALEPPSAAFVSSHFRRSCSTASKRLPPGPDPASWSDIELTANRRRDTHRSHSGHSELPLRSILHLHILHQRAHDSSSTRPHRGSDHAETVGRRSARSGSSVSSAASWPRCGTGPTTRRSRSARRSGPSTATTGWGCRGPATASRPPGWRPRCARGRRR